MSRDLIHSDITSKILGCAVAIHREVGPRLPESSYQIAMRVAMRDAGLTFVEEPNFEATFRGVSIGRYRPDFIVENAVVLELKAVREIEPSAARQILTYLKVTGHRVGLIVNFNAPVIPLGIRRYVL